jgi:beta-phosphoglucomutase-like phosphatase (HAD superfamily)
VSASGPVELVIFDCDGVLIDSERLAVKLDVRLRHELGWPLSEAEVIERFAGRIFSAEDVAAGKPAPDLFLHAAERMDADPARSVVVEDSRAGVEAARAAGMGVLAFAGGLTPAELLEGPGTVLFEDMRALPNLLEACGAT